MKKIHRLLFKQNGNITLFAALSMTFIILFFMVLIDISRILLFSKLTESSVKLASRSVMSAYDYMLYERYGLFGRGGTDGKIIAEQTLHDNIISELNIFDARSPIKLTPIQIQDVDVFYDHYLGEHSQIEHQIVEEMKYKAPIDFTIEIIQTFSGLEQSSAKSHSLVDSLDQLQDLFEQREALISELLDTQNDIASLEHSYPLDQQFSSIVGGYSSYIINLNSEISLLETTDSIKHGAIGRELTEEEIELLDQAYKQLHSVQRSINQYLTMVNQALNKSDKHQQEIRSRLNGHKTKVEEKLNLARTLNNTIRVQYEMLLLKQQSQQNTDQSSSTIDDLQIEFTEEGLLRSPQFFDQYEAEMDEQIQSFESYVDKASSFVIAARNATSQPNLKQQSSVQLDSSYEQFALQRSSIYKNYISPATILEQRAAKINELENVKQQLQQNKNEYKQMIKNMNYVAQLAVVYEQLQKDKDTFDAVQQNYKRNIERNSQIEANKQTVAELSSNGNDNALNSLEQLTGLLASINKLGQQLQAHLYINEYILHRFNHLPLGSLNELVTEESINFYNQSAEYIMLGFSEPSANIAFVIAEIFTIRLAIRTIEGLIANKQLANPILIISAAVLHGLKQAIKDMNELLDEGKTELSKYAPIEISYRNYLRLLLSIHGLARTSLLARIVAVIEQDLQTDFMQIPTSSIVLAKTKTKLWMLPSLSRIVSLTSSETIVVENGYYEKVDYASSSY